MITINGTVLRLKHVITFFENNGYDIFGEDMQHSPIELSYPFSWRGSYDEVAFSLSNTYDEVTNTKNLIMSNAALEDTFHGHKGGDFTYDMETPVNFESDVSSWSDGKYFDNLSKDDVINTILENMIVAYNEIDFETYEGDKFEAKIKHSYKVGNESYICTKVDDDKDCDGCAFFDMDNNFCNKPKALRFCDKDHRIDGNNIIFTKIK